MTSKVEQVKSLFEKPDWYLTGWRYSIRLRSETVKEFVKNATFGSILDIGCGDGSISLPLLTAARQLTLLDLSSAMLDVARSRVEPELLSNVEFVNGDFITARLAPCSYDLILCLGLLAHVESPSAVVGRVISLLKPGGIVVLENAEWNHPITMLGKLYGKVREMLMPSPGAPQNLTPVRSADVLEMFDRSQFRLEGRYHYSLPLPGMTRLFGEQTLYTLSRLIYGAYPDHRNAQFGNECLYHLRSLRSPQQVLESKSSVCLNLSSAGS